VNDDYLDIEKISEFFAGVLGMLAASAGRVVEDPDFPEAFVVVCYTPNNKRFAQTIPRKYAYLFEGIPREDDTSRLDGYTHREGMEALWEMNRYWVQRHVDIADALKAATKHDVQNQ
jgi:hypothetical protein